MISTKKNPSFTILNTDMTIDKNVLNFCFKIFVTIICHCYSGWDHRRCRGNADCHHPGNAPRDRTEEEPRAPELLGDDPARGRQGQLRVVQRSHPAQRQELPAVDPPLSKRISVYTAREAPARRNVPVLCPQRHRPRHRAKRPLGTRK